MSNTYTPNAKLAMPAVGDTGWSTPVNGNASAIDALNPIGDLCVTTHEVPSTSLNVAVSGGLYLSQANVPTAYAGSASQAVAASSTNYVYLTAAGVLTVSTSGWPAAPNLYIPLAIVATNSTAVTSIADARACFPTAGAAIPVVTHLLSAVPASAPTIAAGSAAGTSPTVAVAGTDVAGTVSITTGTSPATGVLATVTFNLAFGSAPRAVLLTAANAATAAAMADWFAAPGGLTTTGFTLNAGVALSASTAYEWFYTIIG